jgi:hypothetical protein
VRINWSHIDIAETKLEGFTIVHGSILSFTHRHNKHTARGIRIRTVSLLIRAKSLGVSQPWSINLPDDIRTVQQAHPVSRLERNTGVLVEIRVQ